MNKVLIFLFETPVFVEHENAILFVFRLFDLVKILLNRTFSSDKDEYWKRACMSLTHSIPSPGYKRGLVQKIWNLTSLMWAFRKTP